MKNLFNSAIPYVVGIFLLFVTFQTLKLHFEDQKTISRLTDNLAAVQKENVYYKARNGDQAVKLQSQELTIKEIRATIPAVIRDLKNLYIQPRQLRSIVQGTSVAEKHVFTTLRDSVIMDTIKIKLIDYRDAWFTIKGAIAEKTADLTINTSDSLTVVNYLSKRPHPWLWIFGGKRHPEAVISNKNPFIKYSITKSITVKD